MDYVLCSVGQMNFGVYGVTPLKANILQPLPERFRMEPYVLGNGFLAHSLGSLIVKGMMDPYKYASLLAQTIPPLCGIFSQDDGIYRQDYAKCHTADSVLVWIEEHKDER
ncbi:hypothetical protein TNCV_3907351 [Trichonephila clavipes]|nr:hypothetical protein TNCV_3907351 [Trichonephila clavipes]